MNISKKRHTWIIALMAGMLVTAQAETPAGKEAKKEAKQAKALIYGDEGDDSNGVVLIRKR